MYLSSRQLAKKFSLSSSSPPHHGPEASSPFYFQQIGNTLASMAVPVNGKFCYFVLLVFSSLSFFFHLACFVGFHVFIYLLTQLILKPQQSLCSLCQPQTGAVLLPETPRGLRLQVPAIILFVGLPIQERAWRQGSAVQSACCLSRELGFSLQHPHWVANSFLLQPPRDLTPPSDFCRHLQTCSIHSHRHTHK